MSHELTGHKSVDPFSYITFSACSEIRQPLLGLSTKNNYGKEYWVPAQRLGVSREYQNAIFQRDHQVCHFCGFRSKKYMQCLIKNAQEWYMDEAITACIFCAQCLALDTVAEMKSGTLIYLPELLQTKLNQLMKIVYICRISQGEQAESAKQLLKLLIARTDKADKIISSNPEIYIEHIKDCCSAEDYEKIQDISIPLRLLPMDRRIIKEQELEFNQFPQIMAWWRSKDGPFGGLQPPYMDLRVINDVIDLLKN